jgi:hypothetical protein
MKVVIHYTSAAERAFLRESVEVLEIPYRIDAAADHGAMTVGVSTSKLHDLATRLDSSFSKVFKPQAEDKADTGALYRCDFCGNEVDEKEAKQQKCSECGLIETFYEVEN